MTAKRTWLEKRSDRRAVAGLLAIVAVPAAQLLATGFPHAYDSRMHVVWSRYFADQLWQGELYPRWLADIGHGFGGPVFFFYPPLPYYVTSAFHPFLPQPEAAHVRLALGTCCALLAAALAMFAWLRPRLGASPAALGAALYTLAPYHVLIDVWLRGAYAEVWAFVWPPLLLLGIDVAHRSPWRALVVVAGATAGLFLTHLPTAVTALPLVGAWALAGALFSRRPALVSVAGAGLALGAGLAGAYLATALTHGAYVRQETMFEGLYDYRRSFLFAAMPLTPRGWVQGGALAMTAACLAAGLALARARREIRFLARFASLAAAGYLVLMLPVSEPLWELFAPLRKIQFPWRMSIELVLLASAALAAVFAHAARARPGARPALAVGGSVLVLALLLPTVLAEPHKRMKPARLARYLADNRNATEHLVPSERDPRALLPDGVRTALVEGRGEVRVAVWRPRRIELRVASETPGRLAVRQQLYPGWEARLAGADAALPVDVLRAYGIVGVDLPPGSHRLVLTLGPTPHERAGWAASGVSLALLAGAAGLAARRSPAAVGTD
jgi:hypothetical protein